MSVDPLQQLKTLAELHQSGVLTEAEFTAKKAELLAQVGKVSPPAASPNQGAAPAVAPNRAASLNAPANTVTAPAAKVSNDDITFWQNEVASRQQEFRKRKDEVDALEKQLQSHESSQVGAARRSQYPDVLLWLRAMAVRAPAGLLGVAGVIVGTAAFFSIMLAITFTLSAVPIFVLFLVGTSLGMLLALHVLFFPDNDGLVRWKQRLQGSAASVGEKIAATQQELAAARAAVDAAQAKLQEAAVVCDRLNSVFHSRRHRLQSTDWLNLRGPAFVTFLKELFEEQGYTVQTTKAGVHPGVDLIVERGGSRIAVQGRGQAGTLSSSAVQDAHAGMSVYKCQRCVIITTATFNSSAVNLANQIGCRLIAANQFGAIVQGKGEI